MLLRRIAGCALLSVTPAIFVTIAILDDSVTEMLLGTAIAFVISATILAGLYLLESTRQDDTGAGEPR